MPRMLDLQNLLLFEAIATHGSLSAASRAVGVPKATLSRRLSQLERQAGVRLIRRTTRSLSLTEAGTLLHERSERVAEEVAAARATLEHLQGDVRGTLRVAADPAIGRLLVTPVLPDFLVRHPEVRLEFRLTSRLRDPIAQGVDILLSARDLPQTTLVSRQVWTTGAHVYASPAYLGRRRAPTTPDDLRQHSVLAFSEKAAQASVTWTLARGGQRREVTVVPVLVADEPTPLVAAAIAGRGLVLAADLLVGAEVAAGRLVRVLPEWAGPQFSVKIYLAGRHGLPPKTRAFADFLADRLGRADGPAPPAQGRAPSGRP